MSFEQDPYFLKFCPATNTGSIIIAQFDPSIKLISPDVFAYFEDLLDIKLCAVQLVRDGFMNPTNLVFAQATSFIDDSQIAKIQNITFKQTHVDSLLIKSPEKYKNTIDALVKLKLSQIALPPAISEGICYVTNFANIDIEAKFSPFGEITSIDLIDLPKSTAAHAIHFANSTSAFRAAKILNRKSGMLVGAICVRDSRHNLYIRNVSNANNVIEKTKEIGEVSAFKVIDKNIYIKMANLVDAQIACALLTADDIKSSFVCDETADKFLYN